MIFPFFLSEPRESAVHILCQYRSEGYGLHGDECAVSGAAQSGFETDDEVRQGQKAKQINSQIE